MTDPRAGQPAAAEDLVDVAKLVTAYYAVHPDPGDAVQRVSFGTSGHRGSAFTATFNEDHILATTQAICEYRAAPGDRRAAVPGRRHARACPSRRRSARSRCSPPTRSGCMVDARGGYTPTPAVSRAILAHNASGGGRARRRDRGHALAQPAAGRRVQVQPARRRPGRHRHHRADPGPGERAARRRAEGRAPGAVRPGGRGRTPPGSSTSSAATWPRSGRWWTWPRSGRPGCASAPTRSAGRAWPTGARSATATAWT